MEGLSEHDRVVLKTIFDPFQASALSGDPAPHPQTEKEELDASTLDIVRRAICCAEHRNFEECLKLFDDALRKTPRSPSILNDRAQALRLAGRDEEALKDLDLAVEYSGGRGRAGVQALCQRGALYRSMNMDEKAVQDFSLAAKRGSDFAAAQLVSLDPYANMGNAVLQEIAQKSN